MIILGSSEVLYEINALRQDFYRKFGSTTNEKYMPIILSFQINKDGRFDHYSIKIEKGHITFSGTDAIGLIHGIYNFSHEILGIDPFFYFSGIMPKSEPEISVKTQMINSKPFSVKYMDFFFNDEDLLEGFKMQKP